ncbi:hypothetical protein BACCIP111895_01034 [Neobacillus rhizosphaerae]|uniref:Glycosyl transferase family 1 domain-containing protein n=1 Tax=Neobacillus rhizosphaerae TaxID=2880965 RepID=A0ABM9EMP6_9BACI|nr:glycosyltransferase family 4 protein [Neobacillus rhizosphaerae]CAH2713880.1 hypothetical protein BACCIP111895_01034 [Neobacillus rhizosphaerae]
MKILLIGPFPEPITGSSLANEILLDGLVEKGHMVDFLDTNTEKSFTNLSSQGKFNIKKVFSSVSPILKGVCNILFKKYDAVYITPAQSYIGFLKYTPFIDAACLKRIPVYIHFHGGFVRKMFDSINEVKQLKLKRYFNKCESVIVLGQSLKKMFEGIIPPEKVRVCENGIEDKFILSSKELKEKVLTIDSSEKLEIIYLSNLMKTKGILDLLEACKQLKEENIDFHLNIAGNIEPDVKEEFERYLLMLERNITYHGVVKGDAKRELLLKAHVFCLPTYYPNEGQPISILEAMGMGCAIVTTSQGGINDIFKDKMNGLQCTSKDINDIASCMKKVRVDIANIIKNNTKKVEDNYMSNNFVNRVVKIMENKMEN